MGEFPDEICKVSTNKLPVVFLLRTFLVVYAACIMQKLHTYITMSDDKIGYATNNIFCLVYMK